MSKTSIEWADRVWNPITGCTPVSAGCDNCYAARMASRLAGRFGYPADDAFRVTVHSDKLNAPLRWTTRQRVFVNSMGDLFHEDVPIVAIARVFAVMASARQHTYLVLTKRPELMAEVLTSPAFRNLVSVEMARLPWSLRPAWDPIINDEWPLPNVWLGVSAENQAAADARIPLLLATPAAVHFVSCEPLLGRVNLNTPMPGEPHDGVYPPWYIQSGLDWVIAGRETGPGARPCDRRWVEQIVAQCRDAGVPVFVKPPFADEYPELNVQQFPEVRA